MERVSVGRVVHYVAPATERYLVAERLGASPQWMEQPHPEAGQHLAAIIVGLPDAPSDYVNLQVFHNRPSMEFLTEVAYHPGGEPGTWHWPERL